jgi:hypothetical protein
LEVIHLWLELWKMMFYIPKFKLLER